MGMKTTFSRTSRRAGKVHWFLLTGRGAMPHILVPVCCAIIPHVPWPLEYGNATNMTPLEFVDWHLSTATPVSVVGDSKTATSLIAAGYEAKVVPEQYRHLGHVQLSSCVDASLVLDIRIISIIDTCRFEAAKAA